MIANKDGGVLPNSSEWMTARRSSRAAMLPHDALASALDRTSDWLLARQTDEGYWVGELEGDTILESEYILLMAFLGLRIRAGLRALRTVYPGSPARGRRLGDLSRRPDRRQRLGQGVFRAQARRASRPTIRRWCARAGRSSMPAAPTSATASRGFIWRSWARSAMTSAPACRPSWCLIPSRLGFSLSAMSAWTRTIVVPLSIMAYYKPVRSLPAERGHRRAVPRRSRPAVAPHGPLAFVDQFLPGRRPRAQVARSLGPRRLAAARPFAAAHRWMLEHCENTDGLGAIFPPMVYSIIALRCLDYDLDSPAVQWAHEAARRPAHRRGRPGSRAALPLAGLGHGDRHRLRWPTPGCPPIIPHGRARSSGCSPRKCEIPGDWRTRRPGVEPTGWHFQFHNAFYPDLDDSAMVVLALNRSPLANDPAVEAATRRGVNWLLSMQNRDGGWAAYDVDIDNQVLTQLPFADHNAMLDPSCADITARVLELLGHARLSRRPSVDRPRSRLPVEHPGARGLLVRPLGRQLHLRNLAGLAGLEGPRFSDGSPADPEGRGMARIDPAALGWLGRNLPELRRPGLEGDRRADSLADGLGHAGPDRRRPRILAGRPQRHRLPGPDPVARRLVGRAPVHRHRFSHASSTFAITFTACIFH